MKLLLFFLIFANAKSHIKTDYDTIYDACIIEMQSHHLKKSAASICACHKKNLCKRLNTQFASILAKSYLKQSVKKEMETVEGAQVIPDFDASVKTHCIANSKWDVGPEDKGEPDDVPPKKK
jgi:hypothetical protein